MAEYRPPATVPDPAGPYPLRLLTLKRHYSINSSYGSLPVLLERRAGGRRCEIHPDDAAARGIADGDPADVYNDLGRDPCTPRPSPTARAAPARVTVPFGRWRADDGGGANSLTSDAPRRPRQRADVLRQPRRDRPRRSVAPRDPAAPPIWAGISPPTDLGGILASRWDDPARRRGGVGVSSTAKAASTAARSSSVSVHSTAATLALICSGEVAPAITEAIAGRAASQAKASSSRLSPRSAATASRAATSRWFRSLANAPAAGRLASRRGGCRRGTARRAGTCP